MTLEPDADVSGLNGLAIPARARYLARVRNIQDLTEAAEYARRNRLSLIPLGGGTNTVWGRERLEILLAKIEIPGFEIQENNPDDVLITIGAGELWDECVQRAVTLNLSGIEALSAIPGTAGAAAVQNIGAYGAEISQVFEKLEAYDLDQDQLVTLTKNDCRFGYRKSIFKENPCLVITSIVIRLSKRAPGIPNYKDVEEYFRQQSAAAPTLLEIRRAIIEIRSRKLPDPAVIPNCGSFFKNPILPLQTVLALKRQFPDLPYYPQPQNAKISAGWLLELAGFKGHSFGAIAIYPHNALVLTAPHRTATVADVRSAVTYIKSAIKEKFGIELDEEVVTIT